MNKKGNVALIVLGVIIAIIVILGIWAVSTNNSLVTMEETLKQNQAEIDNQLLGRSELIPNLVNTVKGATKQEQGLVDSVTEARAKMTTGSTQDRLNADAQLSKTVSLIVENYPEMKTNQNFMGLSDELASTENKVIFAKKKYNDSVAEYNKKLKRFPSNIIAGMFGHSEAKYLEVSDENKQNPNVEF